MQEHFLIDIIKYKMSKQRDSNSTPDRGLREGQIPPMRNPPPPPPRNPSPPNNPPSNTPNR
jgi:hypothetical protein